ncbi:lamin tail domain-containing protein [Candidatus Riflebacteria bacterium]
MIYNRKIAHRLILLVSIVSLLTFIFMGCAIFQPKTLDDITDIPEKTNNAERKDDSINPIKSLLIHSGTGFSLRPGASISLTAIAYFADGTSEDLTAEAKFSSDNENIASISESGTLTAKTPGSVLIQVAVGDVKSEKQAVLVTTLDIAYFEIISVTTVLTVGKTTQFIASATFSDGSQDDISGVVQWQSSNSAVASIDNNGLLTGLAAGTISISASVATFTSNPISVTIIGGAKQGDVLINEIVVDPQKDWDDSEGGDATPFNDKPGTADPSSSDEWVELYNSSTNAISIRGWKLLMQDTTPATVEFGVTTDVTLVFSSASGTVDNFPAKSYLVVGNPAGVMNNDVYLALTDDRDNVIDDVEIGDDPENDEPDDGAPDSGLDGNASGASDESIARVPNGTDTDNDVKDFDQAEATIGAANPSGGTGIGEQGTASLGEALINEVCVDPQNDWSDASGGNNVPFDKIAGTGTVSSSDEFVELKNASNRVLNFNGFQLVMVDTTIATETIGLGDAELYISAGSTISSVQPGGYVVIGNPAGTMNNDVYLILYDSAGTLLDDVEVGSDPEADGDDGAPTAGSSDGNAADSSDEVIARVPDGADTDNDVNDFFKVSASPGENNGTGVKSISIIPAIASFSMGTLNYYASATLIDNSEIAATTKVDWSSLATDVFTVNSSGVVSYIGPGAGQLQAASGTTTSSATVIALYPSLVVITEVNNNPEADWDGSGYTVPAAAITGGTTTDEYIEIKNISSQSINLTDWTIFMKDSTPATDTLTVADTLVFSGGSSITNFQPGHYCVLGNPTDSMNNDVYVELRNPAASGAVLFDSVEVGNGDYRGDGGPYAPEPTSAVSDDEAISRIYVDQDTNNDAYDFKRASGTPVLDNEIK